MEILKVRNLDTVNLIFDNLLYIYYIIGVEYQMKSVHLI